MKKVGNKLNPDSDKYFTYIMVEYDKDGWVDASLFHPIDYDLLYLRIEGLKDIIRGWCSGNVWDGMKWKDGYKVLFWKRDKNDA